MIDVETIFDSDREEYEFMQQKKEQPMKEQIEEMRKDLQKSEHWYFDEKSVDFELDRRKTAENLYNAGYRKQSEGVWIERIYKPYWLEDDVEVFYSCSLCETSHWGMSTYCPNCGAHMRGGKNE